MSCSKCGNILQGNAKFCNKCGKNVYLLDTKQQEQTRFSNPQIQKKPIQPTGKQQEKTDKYDTPQVRMLIGNNSYRYINKFKQMESTGKTISWNWAAYFFHIFWMFYKKPGGSAFFWGILILVSIPLSLFLYQPLSMITFIGLIYIGMKADYWYKLKIDSLISYNKN